MMEYCTTLVEPVNNQESPTCGIQEAIDSLGPNGGRVTIPAGIYELRRAIRLPSRVALQGEGEATVLTRPPLTLMYLQDDTQLGECDLHIDQPDGLREADQIRVMDNLQRMYYSRELYIEAIGERRLECTLLYGEPERIYRVADHAWAANLFPAITSFRTDGVTIADLTIDGGLHEYNEEHTGDFLGAGIHTFKVWRLRINNVTVQRWPGDGMSVQGGSAIITGCIAEGCLGAGFHPGSGISRSVWSNNLSSHNQYGFMFCQQVRNATVGQNVFIENSEHGITGLGEPDRGNALNGNICSENGGDGIEAHMAFGNALVGNVCRNNSQSSPGRSAAISLTAHLHNTVVGNVCFDDQVEPTQAVGISSGDPLASNVIAANYDGEQAGEFE